MNKRGFIDKLFLLIIIVVLIVGYTSVKLGNEEEAKAGAKNLIGRAIDNLFDKVFDNRGDVETITLANWNIQIFGQAKASNLTLMEDYVDIISNYDIVFVQEIRDISGESFELLCNMLEDYQCNVSSRAGRSSSKEQYGVIYKEGIEIINFEDFNPDKLDRWERPPIKVEFNVSGYYLTTYNIHVKPSDVQIELYYLENVVIDRKNVIILGDLNADCSYYNEKNEKEFESWNWIIKTGEDTTLASSSCAYDRILMNNNAYKEFVSKGIHKQGITKAHSDHYLVWVEIEIEE